MLKFLLIVFIILYLISFLVKWFFNSLIKKATSGANYDQSYGQNRQEGDVTINQQPEKSKLFKKDDGEYVDYEEVND